MSEKETQIVHRVTMTRDRKHMTGMLSGRYKKKYLKTLSEDELCELGKQNKFWDCSE